MSSGKENEQAIQKATEDLTAVRDALVAWIPDHRCLWNGRVELLDQNRFEGQALFTGEIILHPDVIQSSLRWLTYLHEMLHMYSEGYSADDYAAYPGWEEGVVEKLQRLLRPSVLQSLGVSLKEAEADKEDTEHTYNPYLYALEAVRHLINAQQDELDFYLNLHSRPIPERPLYLLEQLRRVHSSNFTEVFFQISNILCTDFFTAQTRR